MYSKKFLYNSLFHSPFSRPNLHFSINVRNAGSGSSQPTDTFARCLCSWRTFKMNNIVWKVLQRNGLVFELVKKKLREQSQTIIRAWTRQCEYVLAQRFIRGQQMFCLYTRMWEEKALKELLKRMRQQMTRRSKELMLGAIGVSTFNWDSEKISDDEMSMHANEFNYLKRLTQKTIVCEKCRLRRQVDVVIPDINYCHCPCRKDNNPESLILDGWEPFIERKEILVWRRKHNNSNYYEYKLYCVYNDVTAEDFLEVQIDTEYRQHWDTTAINLHVVDSDQSTNSDIVYWEMLWPRLFANRDYVYNRRYIIDREQKIITIVSKSIEHPSCPIIPGKYRVRDYQSVMVIRPSTELNQPGIEFTLTYFDNPGVNIPSAVTSWVAMAGMPDFLVRLRQAARDYHAERVAASAEITPPLPVVVEIPIPPREMEEEECAQPISTNAPEPENPTSYWRYIHPYYYMG